MNRNLWFVRFCYILGMVVNFTNAVIYLFPLTISRWLGFQIDVTPVLSFILVQSSSLMIAWTILLAWALMSPVRRRRIMLVTVFPVFFGMAGSALYILVSGTADFILGLGLTTLPLVLGFLLLRGYFMAGQAEKDSRFLYSRNSK